MSEKEKKNIKHGQKEGIDVAKAHGVKFGRPAINYPLNWKEEYEQWINKNINTKTFLESTGLKQATFYRLLKKYKDKDEIQK